MADRYVPTGTPLTDLEREILTVLIEEAAEVQQAAAKLLRFGKGDRVPGLEVHNHVVLGWEIGDLEYLIDCAIGLNLIRTGDVADGRQRKRRRLRQFLQNQDT